MANVVTFDQVVDALKSKNKVLCKTFFDELIVSVQCKKSISHDDLFFRIPTSLSRNFQAELFIPKEEISNQHQMLVALR